jgi:hypothetical protein
MNSWSTRRNVRALNDLNPVVLTSTGPKPRTYSISNRLRASFTVSKTLKSLIGSMSPAFPKRRFSSPVRQQRSSFSGARSGQNGHGCQISKTFIALDLYFLPFKRSVVGSRISKSCRCKVCRLGKNKRLTTSFNSVIRYLKLEQGN